MVPQCVRPSLCATEAMLQLFGMRLLGGAGYIPVRWLDGVTPNIDLKQCEK